MFILRSQIQDVQAVKRLQKQYCIFKYDLNNETSFDVPLFVRNVISKASKLKSVCIYKTNIDPDDLVALKSFTGKDSLKCVKQISYYVFLAYENRQNFEVDELFNVLKPLYFILEFNKNVFIKPQIFSDSLGAEYIHQLSLLFEIRSQDKEDSSVDFIWSNKTIKNETETLLVGTDDSSSESDNLNDEHTKMISQLSVAKSLIKKVLTFKSKKELLDFIESNDEASFMVDVLLDKYEAYQRLKDDVYQTELIKTTQDFKVNDVKQDTLPTFSEDSGIVSSIKQKHIEDNQSKSVLTDEQLKTEIPLNIVAAKSKGKDVPDYLNQFFLEERAYLDSNLIEYVFNPDNKDIVVNFLINKLNDNTINFRQYKSLPKFLVYYYSLKKSTMDPKKRNLFLENIYNYLPKTVKSEYSKYIKQ